MKKLLIICVILTASISYSQGTTQVTDAQKKAAIKNAQKVQVLESALNAQGLVISDFKLQVMDLKEEVAIQHQQLGLWEKNYELLNTQFEAEKAKKPKDKTLPWILRCLGMFAGGYLLGNIL